MNDKTNLLFSHLSNLLIDNHLNERPPFFFIWEGEVCSGNTDTSRITTNSRSLDLSNFSVRNIIPFYLAILSFTGKEVRILNHFLNLECLLVNFDKLFDYERELKIGFESRIYIF